MLRKNSGLAGGIIFVLFVFGLIALFWGYGLYIERFYIKLYDVDSTRYLDIPPYSTRLTSSDKELVGHCLIRLSLTQEQANDFLSGVCRRYGYNMQVRENSISIVVMSDYVVEGVYDGDYLTFSWEPRLTDALKEKAAGISID